MYEQKLQEVESSILLQELVVSYRYVFKIKDVKYLVCDINICIIKSILYGYGGFQLTEEGLTYAPQLPRGVTSLIFRNIHHLDQVFDLHFDGKTSIVTKAQK
jgi:hypothetical protein